MPVKKTLVRGGGDMRHTENIHTQKKCKRVPALGHSAVSIELVSVTSHHRSGDGQEKKSKRRVGKDSHIRMTPPEILLASISAAVAGFNGLPHSPSASPAGFWMGEGPNSHTEALHILP